MSLTINSRDEWMSLYDRREEICNECNTDWIEETCNKCGEGVCMNDKCCEKFPHYFNTNFIICRECATEIEKKLHVLEEDEKEMYRKKDLTLLKIRIKRRMEMRIKQLEE